jgi:peptide/nickel transport system ATP-binding protein/oligopeptide transport system ATP-binding protein
LLEDGTGYATACHRAAELPPPDAIVPIDGSFSPTLERLVAAFSGSGEVSASSGVDTAGTAPPAVA